MSAPENQIEEKKIEENEKSEIKTENNPYSPNLFQEIMSLKDQNTYIISKTLEKKIPEIFSYLLEDSSINSITNKSQLLGYLEVLFKNIDYNSEIFFCKKSNGKENLNVFEVLIHEFVLNTKTNLNNPNEEQLKNIENYKEQLKNIFSILLSKLSFDKKAYHYIRELVNLLIRIILFVLI